MLTTSLRTTQTLDPCTGVAPVVVECVRHRATATSIAAGSITAGETFAAAGTTSIDLTWFVNDRKPMPKVDLHPDRWPLHSTS